MRLPAVPRLPFRAARLIAVSITFLLLVVPGGEAGCAEAATMSDGPRAPGEERISAEGLRKQLMFLASPEFEGREAGARGGRAAARYLALQFAQAGLEPVGPSHVLLDAAAPSYYQPFGIVKFLLNPEQTMLQVRRRSPAESVRTYNLRADFVVLRFAGNVEVTAPLVFAGYGITAPEIGYDDYAGLDVRGRAVLVFDHEPQEMREDSRWGGRAHTREALLEVKALNAQAHGAVALLVAPEPVLEHKDFWTRAHRWLEHAGKRPRQALEDPETTIPVLYLRPRVGHELFAAAGRDPERTQREIDASGRPRSFTIPDLSVVVRLSAKEIDPGITENVVGLIEGSDPALKGEVVIVGAHYDHEGERDGEVYAGADDDGSGTVCVLEMARALASAPRRPRRSVLFAAWGAEEKGLLGSFHYTAHPLFALQKTAAMIQLDMVGRDETPMDEEERARFGERDTRNAVNLLGAAYSPEFRTLLGRLNEGLGLELDYKFERDVEQTIFQRSDQWPFAIRNVPTLFFFTGLHPDYHTPGDTPTKINYAKMERIARLAYRALWAIADAEERPRFQPVPAAAEARP